MSQFIEMIGSKDWPQMKLKDIVHEDCPISYGIVQPGDDLEDGVPIVRPIDMNETHLIDKNTLKHTSKEISDSYSRTVLRGDEILVCVRGTTGLIALADGLKGCNVTRGITPLYFKPQFSRDYLFRAFLGQQVQDYIQDNTIGSTLKGINMSKLRELPICMPPEDVQEQFVTIAQQADKSEFDGLKSQFIEMFGHAEKTKPLSDFIEVSFPGEWGQEDKDGNGVKVIRTTNFTNTGKLNLADVVTRDIDSNKVEKKKLKKGDIILERSGGTNDNPVGRVVYFNEDGLYLFNNFTQLLRCKEEVNSLFIFYSLFNYYQMNKRIIRSMGNKTTGIQNLKMDQYWQIPIADVSLELQERFVSIYHQADKSEYLNNYRRAS